MSACLKTKSKKSPLDDFGITISGTCVRIKVSNIFKGNFRRILKNDFTLFYDLIAFSCNSRKAVTACIRSGDKTYFVILSLIKHGVPGRRRRTVKSASNVIAIIVLKCVCSLIHSFIEMHDVVGSFKEGRSRRIEERGFLDRRRSERAPKVVL